MIGSMEDDVGTIHAHMLAQPLQRLADRAGRPLDGRVDQLPGYAGDQVLEIRSCLERAGVGAQPPIEKAEIDQQQDRREIEQHAKDPGARLGIALLRHEVILQAARLLGHARREQARENPVGERLVLQDQSAMRAQRGGVLAEVIRHGLHRQLIQRCGNLCSRGIVRRRADEAEHGAGKPADNHRHGLAGFALRARRAARSGTRSRRGSSAGVRGRI